MKITSIISILVALALPSELAHAQNKSQFDLHCTGTAEVYRAPNRVHEAFDQTLHIDLARGEYCVDNCGEILRIQGVTPLTITLVDIAPRGGALDRLENKRVIDRRSGKYQINYFDAGQLASLKAEATCARANFTPFPATRF